MNDPRTWPRVLAADFTYTAPKSRGGYTVTVPEGTLLKPIEGEAGFYWVDQFTWCNDDPIARHDAMHYGIRVPESATRERGSVPKAASYNVATRTIRSEPENYWLATADSFDGAVAHDATARAMAAGLGFLHRLAALDAAPIVDQLEAVQALVAEARAALEFK